MHVRLVHDTENLGVMKAILVSLLLGFSGLFGISAGALVEATAIANANHTMVYGTTAEGWMSSGVYNLFAKGVFGCLICNTFRSNYDLVLRPIMCRR